MDKTKFKTFNFSGGIIFKENLKADETKKQLFEANRKEAYLGSKMHFFRALWENNLFYNDKTRMLFGDAKATLQKLVSEVKSL